MVWLARATPPSSTLDRMRVPGATDRGLVGRSLGQFTQFGFAAPRLGVATIHQLPFPPSEDHSMPQANPLRLLSAAGQSVWYDNIQRSMLSSGMLARLIAEDDLRGITSNPTIFEKAIAGSSDYDEALRREL